MNSKAAKSRNGWSSPPSLFVPKKILTFVGCLTCKKRRVKCDETKPFCLRCQHVHATCEGYQGKEYKWRIVKDIVSDKGPQGRSSSRLSPRIRTFATSTQPLPESDPDLDLAFTSAIRAFPYPTYPRVTQAAKDTQDKSGHNETIDPESMDVRNNSS